MRFEEWGIGGDGGAGEAGGGGQPGGTGEIEMTRRRGSRNRGTRWRGEWREFVDIPKLEFDVRCRALFSRSFRDDFGLRLNALFFVWQQCVGHFSEYGGGFWLELDLRLGVVDFRHRGFPSGHYGRGQAPLLVFQSCAKTFVPTNLGRHFEGAYFLG